LNRMIRLYIEDGDFFQMSQPVNRPIKEKSEIGQEVVDGLENTLAWIKHQFDDFRTEVSMNRPVVRAISASSHN